MVSDKQRDEINAAILDYLQTQGYGETAASLRREAALGDGQPDAKTNGILVKKWTSVVRLQTKNIDLESKVNYLMRQLQVDGVGGGKQEKRSPTEWIPRPPEKLTMTGHRLPVTKVLLHPKWPLLLTASEDCTIRVYDDESGLQEKSMKGHTDCVQDLAIEPTKGELLASSSADMSIKLWDLTTYQCTKTLRGHDHNVSSVCFTPSGDRVLSASRDKSIKLWEVTTGFCVRTFHGHGEWVKCVSASPDGVAFASASYDQTIRVWPLSANQTQEGGVVELKGHENIVESVCWLSVAANAVVFATDVVNAANSANNNNGHLTNGDNRNNNNNLAHDANQVNAGREDLQHCRLVVSASRDKTIKLWDTITRSCLHTFIGHDNWVRCVIPHPGGRYLISSSDDRSIRVWSLRDRRLVKSLAGAHSHFVASIDIHPTRPLLASGGIDQDIKIWECR